MRRSCRCTLSAARMLMIPLGPFVFPVVLRQPRLCLLASIGGSFEVDASKGCVAPLDARKKRTRATRPWCRRKTPANSTEVTRKHAKMQGILLTKNHRAPHRELATDEGHAVSVCLKSRQDGSSTLSLVWRLGGFGHEHIAAAQICRGRPLGEDPLGVQRRLKTETLPCVTA